MKVLVMIDSFKNTLKSSTLNNICKINLNENNIQCDCLPIADGGENTLDSLSYKHSHLKRHYCFTYNAFLKPIKTYYLIDRKQKIAYIEIAKIVGFKVNKKKDVFNASSYGIGTLILDAYNTYKVKQIFLCLGGSISNDMGLGMLEALGVSFVDLNNDILNKITLKDFAKINQVDFSNLKPWIKKVKFNILSDVINPLSGPLGATNYYGKQKGLIDEQLEYVDNIIENIANKIDDKSIYKKGAGAAGGIGYAAISVLNAQYKSGIKYILKYHNFTKIKEKYDLIITGEGQVDHQSFKGKVISGILKLAKEKKVYILCAKSTLKKDNIFPITDYFSLNYSLKHPSECFDKFCKIIIDKKIKVLN